MYMSSYLKAHGQDCTIQRIPPVETKVSLQRATKAVRIYGAREAHWQGLILSDANLQSGEVFTANNMTFLTQSVAFDPAAGEPMWFAVLVNTYLIHKREEEGHDEQWNPVVCWQTINGSVPAFGEIVNYLLRQQDPGLLEGTQYIFQVAKEMGFQNMDRIIYAGNNYKVESVDDVAMEGIVRLQASQDTRIGDDCVEEED
jgi:hypothetical protein